MDKQTWIGIKQHQIELYTKRANKHKRKRGLLTFAYVMCIITVVFLPWPFFGAGNPLVGLGLFILIPVAMLVWKISTHENRVSQLLRQLASEVGWEIKKDRPLEDLQKATTVIETRFLSNDDELFVKKAIWSHFLDWKKRKRDEEIRYERAVAQYEANFSVGLKPMKQWVGVGDVSVGPVWNTDIPHRQGYKDSNTIEDEWAIMKAFRQLIFASKTVTYGVLLETSNLAQQNPVVFERYLRKKKISKKMKHFKWRAGVHYLSAAAKMRMVTFVDSVLALEPKDLNEATVTLLHEKNEQIKKYTDEFWKVHRRSLKFYWFEALWLLLLIPFIGWAGNLIADGAVTEGILIFTVGAALVAFGEMALVVRQKIKLNGKKLIPPLIASLIGSRHAMCADTKCEEGVDAYRRRFKNLEKHFIMTTPEIDSVKYVKENLRDEERTSKLHQVDAICEQAESRMATYYRMFHLYRRKCLQYGCIEMFLGIMLVPVWGAALIGAAYMGYFAMDLFFPVMLTITIAVFEIIAVWRHVRVWRFKEMYFKIYQGLSVLMVDGDLRAEPEKLNDMFNNIERSALRAISTDPAMKLMVGTLSRVSGLEVPTNVKMHELDKRIEKIRRDREEENRRNNNISWR